MLQIVILDRATLGSDLDLTPLDCFGHVIVYDTTSEEETLERIRIADIVITNKVHIAANLMHECEKLQLICIAATGMNNVDLQAAQHYGITVKNVTGYSTKSVAQHTFSMLFFLLEQMRYYNDSVQSGRWTQSGLFTDLGRPFREIAGKQWGIIGLGRIGQEVARLAEAFGAEASYHSTSGKNLRHGYPHKSLEFILKDSDIISIHAPLNDETYNLINELNLPYIKEKAILLNLGRGGIINETDLAYELDRREIYAGLDVLEKEPIDPSNRLNDVSHKERLLITPHIAWASIEARHKLLEGIVLNIATFLKQTIK